MEFTLKMKPLMEISLGVVRGWLTELGTVSPGADLFLTHHGLTVPYLKSCVKHCSEPSRNCQPCVVMDSKQFKAAAYSAVDQSK